jgi:hypothetical protein
MVNWDEEELHEATRTLLIALMFCRKKLFAYLSRFDANRFGWVNRLKTNQIDE